MKIYKKILAVGMAVVTTLASVFVSNAEEQYSSLPDMEFIAYSYDFPDAYIIVESSPMSLLMENNHEMRMNELTATAFVDEEYALVDGEPVVVSSRLLSRDEVEEIGIENFGEQEALPVNDWVSVGTTYDRKYKCTLTMGATYMYEGQGVKWALFGSGGWSSPGFTPSEYPSTGSDYIGYIWSGGLEGIDPRAELTWSYSPPASQSKEITTAKIEPNKAYIWSFDEMWSTSGPQHGIVTLADVTIYCKKNVLTGGGNTATAVLEYIHTYESMAGTLSVSSTGLGFSLSGVEKQWSFAIQMTGLPY